jgi:hypothetical protein
VGARVAPREGRVGRLARGQERARVEVEKLEVDLIADLELPPDREAPSARVADGHAVEDRPWFAVASPRLRVEPHIVDGGLDVDGRGRDASHPRVKLLHEAGRSVVLPRAVPEGLRVEDLAGSDEGSHQATIL